MGKIIGKMAREGPPWDGNQPLNNQPHINSLYHVGIYCGRCCFGSWLVNLPP